MKIKLSELRQLVKEQYKDVLDNENVEDVKAEEDTWAGGENLVNKVDHQKVYKIKENKRTGEKRKVRKMQVNELRSLVLESLSKHGKSTKSTSKKSKASKKKSKINEIFGFGKKPAVNVKPIEFQAFRTESHKHPGDPASRFVEEIGRINDSTNQRKDPNNWSFVIGQNEYIVATSKIDNQSLYWNTTNKHWSDKTS